MKISIENHGDLIVLFSEVPIGHLFNTLDAGGLATTYFKTETRNGVNAIAVASERGNEVPYLTQISADTECDSVRPVEEITFRVKE